MVALAKAGVGHVAVLRDPSHQTGVGIDPPLLEPADVSLGLQYLTTFRVLVVADDVPAAVVPVAAEAAGFAGAHLVLLVPAGPAGGSRETTAGGDATVLAAPKGGDDGAFARLVGAYAAGVDGGADPAGAFSAAVAAVGWEALEPRPELAGSATKCIRRSRRLCPVVALTAGWAAPRPAPRARSAPARCCGRC